ncbi:MAG TPA: chitobiase/beta-hexosaminidase C-terminal domain-containing protein [Myxococcales bacterium LLY-WYZ-16_1]|nr:chitobiase/beta-hexosaminidase C-terminal domain-containing protein [Myxococcales bacterium LLY-WYZ-16_1]
MKRLLPRPAVRWLAALTLVLGPLGCGPGPEDSTDDGTGLSQPDLALVVFPPGGSFRETIEVQLVPSHPDARMYYTLDGTSPVPTRARAYEGPLVLDETTLVSAIAVGPDGGWSKPVSALFDHEPPFVPATPPERALAADADQVVFIAREGMTVMSKTVRLRSAGTGPVRILSTELRQAPQGDLVDSELFDDGAFALPAPIRDELMESGQTLELEIRYAVTRTMRSAELIVRTDALNLETGLLRLQVWGRMFP